MSTGETFCGTTLLSIGEYYAKNISGYLDIPVCLIGIIFNLFNLLVFTRRNMMSPVHLIFAHLTFTDLIVLLGGTLYSGILNIERNGVVEKGWTYMDAVLYVFCNDLITTFHLMSVFLTVQLAIWRYIAIAYPLKDRFWCNIKTTRNVVIIGYIVCILLSVPIYLSRHVEEVQSINTTDHQESSYKQFYTKNPILLVMSFMVYGILGTILPAIAIAVFSLRLIVMLLARKTQHKHSTQSSNMASSTSTKNHETKQVDRSVVVLLTVLALFLIAEFPRGILFLTNMFYHVESSVIHNRCYATLISIFISIVYINTSITFIVYYTMSQQFRLTFKALFSGNMIDLPNRTVYVTTNAKKTDANSDTGETHRCSSDI